MPIVGRGQDLIHSKDRPRRRVCAKCFHSKDSHQVFLGEEQRSGCQVWMIGRIVHPHKCPCDDYQSPEVWKDLIREAERESRVKRPGLEIP